MIIIGIMIYRKGSATFELFKSDRCGRCYITNITKLIISLTIHNFDHWREIINQFFFHFQKTHKRHDEPPIIHSNMDTLLYLCRYPRCKSIQISIKSMFNRLKKKTGSITPKILRRVDWWLKLLSIATWSDHHYEFCMNKFPTHTEWNGWKTPEPGRCPHTHRQTPFFSLSRAPMAMIDQTRLQ